MLITCPRCQTKFMLADELLPVGEEVVKVKCSRCGQVFAVPAVAVDGQEQPEVSPPSAAAEDEAAMVPPAADGKPAAGLDGDEWPPAADFGSGKKEEEDASPAETSGSAVAAAAGREEVDFAIDELTADSGEPAAAPEETGSGGQEAGAAAATEQENAEEPWYDLEVAPATTAHADNGRDVFVGKAVLRRHEHQVDPEHPYQPREPVE